jgi:lysophospholipase L1-like esterase
MAFIHHLVAEITCNVCCLFSIQIFHLVVIGKPYRSYAAIGDSLSEGLGDFTFHLNRNHNGWTDRLAGILAQEAKDSGYEFEYANLALRGSKLSKIMDTQLKAALRLQPDLVTVMAGSNDLMSKPEKLPELREIYRDGIHQLLAAGCDVVVANTINPCHLNLFKPLRYRAERFSEMIEDVAREFDLPVLDVYSIPEFSDLAFWAQDMVHFSGHGHIEVANKAAELLDLKYRYPRAAPGELGEISRSVLETISWIGRDVIPFFDRKMRGVTSGDGLSPKHSKLSPFVPQEIHPHWQLIRS